MKFKLTALALASACSIAYATDTTFFAVVPMKSISEVRSLKLADVKIPKGSTSAAYTYELRDLLQIHRDRYADTSLASWNISAGELPTGVELTGSKLIGVPVDHGVSSFEITALYKGQSVSKTYDLLVDIPLALTTANMPEGLTSNPYLFDFKPLLSSEAISFNGKLSSWRLADGATLPAGLVVTPEGELKGTPTEGFAGKVSVVASYKGYETEQHFDLKVHKLNVTLAAVPAFTVTHGVGSTFNVAGQISITGDPSVDKSKVVYSLAGAPAGVTINQAGVVNWGATAYSAENSVTVVATYKNVKATQVYRVTSKASITLQASGARTYSNGQVAESCNAYLRGGQYAGATGSGVYTIQPAGQAAFNVYCEMVADGGGWTLLIKQAARDMKTLRGDTGYWIKGTVLNDSIANMNTNNGNFVSKAYATLPATQFRLTAANESTSKIEDMSTIRTGLVAMSNANRRNYSDANGAAGTVTYPNWGVHTQRYGDNNSDWILTSRFGFNHAQIYDGGPICAARWGWTSNENSNRPGTHDYCGGLGSYGRDSNGSNSPNTWMPATHYLWAR